VRWLFNDNFISQPDFLLRIFLLASSKGTGTKDLNFSYLVIYTFKMFNATRDLPKTGGRGAHGVSSFHDLIDELLGNRFKGELAGSLFKTLAVGAHLSVNVLYQKIGNPFLF
jgi:hypothetical protein